MDTITYVPLELDLIDEGRFRKMIEADLKKVQKQLVEFKDEYGELSKGAKAELNLKVSFVIENVSEDQFSIKAITTVKTPARPASVSLAIGATGDDGQLALFVRRSGSKTSSPRQGALCTEDGKAIDPDTGEVHAPEGVEPADG